MKIYLVWTHHEYGPEYLSSTFCPGALAGEVVRRMVKDRYSTPAITESLDVLMEELPNKPTIDNDDCSAGQIQLSHGWGGLHVQVTDTDDFGQIA